MCIRDSSLSLSLSGWRRLAGAPGTPARQASCRHGRYGRTIHACCCLCLSLIHISEPTRLALI
eukprot:13406552-Alexandrium_andersonii.AAC.1